MEAKKIVTRDYADNDACQICGKELRQAVPGIPAAPVYAFESGGALCPGCAKAIAKQTGQDIGRRWYEDAMLALYGKDATKGGKKVISNRRGRKKTVYDERCTRMHWAMKRLPGEDYAILYLHWNGDWPKEMPNTDAIGRRKYGPSLDGIMKKARDHGQEMLAAAEAKLLEPSRRAWILDGASDLDDAFSERASNFLWKLNVRTLSDLDWFSLDAAIATTRHGDWYEFGIDPKHGIAGIIAEIYAWMMAKYGPDCACGTGIRGRNFECEGCRNHDYCRIRPKDDFDGFGDLDDVYDD